MNHNTKRSGRGRVKEGGRMKREEERRGIRRSRRERERERERDERHEEGRRRIGKGREKKEKVNSGNPIGEWQQE